MTKQDIANAILNRVRSRGVNWGGPTGNLAGDFEPPYYLNLEINNAYNETLARTEESPIATVTTTFPSVLNATSYPLNPLPANGGTPNPAAMRVYEMTYTPIGTPEQVVAVVSTEIFQQVTGRYTRRFGPNVGPRPYIACQLYGARRLDIFPGTTVAGDIITVRICPDPQGSPPTVPAAAGGILVNDSDVPIFPSQFHQAIIERAVYMLLDLKNRGQQRKEASDEFEAIIDRAIWFGLTLGEGMAEQRVVDTYKYLNFESWS